MFRFLGSSAAFSTSSFIASVREREGGGGGPERFRSDAREEGLWMFTCQGRPVDVSNALQVIGRSDWRGNCIDLESEIVLLGG